MMACRRMLATTLCIVAFFASTVLSQESNVTWTEIWVSGDVPNTRQLHTAVVSPSGRMWLFAGRHDDMRKLWIHGGEDNTYSTLSDLWYLQTEDLGAPTWTEVFAGSPPARKDHSAVLTASGKMFICFGNDGASYQNDLLYIDLEEPSPWWNTVTACCNSPPTARISRRAQLSDAGRMRLGTWCCFGVWVFGGYGDGRTGLTCVLSVPAIGTVPAARADTATVLTSTGRFWMFGGSTSGSNLENDLWYMDVEAASPTWTQSFETNLGAHVCFVADGDDEKEDEEDDGDGDDDDDYDYDAKWNTRKRNGAAWYGSRKYSTAVLVGESQMWIFGGNNGISLNQLWIAEVPSPAFNQTVLTSSPDRYLHTAVLGPSGRMWIFGGLDGDIQQSRRVQNDLWYYDTEASATDFVQSSPSGTAPSPVIRHTAVLSTVGNMWVFGGETNGGRSERFNRGWEYVQGTLVNSLHKIDVEVQPESPQWTQVYPTGYIEPRRDHTAVITLSDRMWIFGGVEQTYGRRNDLVYIDLEADSPNYVTASTSGSLPHGRGLPKAVLNQTSNRMWSFICICPMFGGYSSEVTYENDLWYVDLQDGVTLTWNEVSPTVKPPARVDMAGALSSDGRLGNLDDLWVIKVTAASWELTWQPVDPVTVNGSPGARKFHSALITPAGDMLMYGGRNDGSRSPGNECAFQDMWSLSPVAPATTILDAEWSQVSATDTPDGRVYSSAAMSSDGRMWCVHGYMDSPSYSSVQDLFYIDTQVDPGQHDWTQVSQPGTSLPTARSGHSTILTESGRLYVHGGTDSRSPRPLKGVFLREDAPYLFGGQTGIGTLANDLGYIDLTMGGSSWWSDIFPTGTLPSARYKHSTVMNSALRMWMTYGTLTSRILQAAGIKFPCPVLPPPPVLNTPLCCVLSDVWYIDVEVSSPAWVQMIASASNPGARRAHSAALTADNEMWIFSGYDGVDNELWYLEAASPAWVSAGDWTNARYDHASGLTASGRAVVFGGYSGSSAMNDLWAFDTQASSSSWYEISTCCPPSARYSHTAVMTSAGIMWICGGWDGASTFGDLWYIDVEAGASYDSLHYIDLEASNRQWVSTSPPGDAPPALLKPSAATNAAGQQMVMLAGIPEL
eukprot:s1455_g1.t1